MPISGALYKLPSGRTVLYHGIDHQGHEACEYWQAAGDDYVPAKQRDVCFAQGFLDKWAQAVETKWRTLA